MTRANRLSTTLLLLPLLAGCRRISWQVIAAPPEPPARQALDEGGGPAALTANPGDAAIREGHLDEAAAAAGVFVAPAGADRDPRR